MDISTLTPDKQVKLQYWLNMIRQCRSSGLTNYCIVSLISVKTPLNRVSAARRLNEARRWHR
ncbi:hypothetical protein C823_001216 [Eubacterium plexicaudatum ASF492]|uniref:Uncharacterized protein n=1 Tax=Eubacterium plexicaudatum ASF492 TaxID=1235802 RepID=N2BAA1_9FIRM|nr:hypothetical protein C823_001216 [Eubacterium plexicaudatum ASF492]